MADQGAALFQALYYHPGNPAFPTLPDPSDPVLGWSRTELGFLADFDGPSPVEAPVEGGAAVAVGFADWYLGKLWVTPSTVDFGSINDVTERQVTIHNTHRTGVSLNDIDASAVEGVDDTAPALPVLVDAFSDVIVTLQAEAEGPSSFDDFIDFVFSIETLPVRVIGERIIVFKAIPERGILEQLRYRTDLMRSKDGTEQAFGLRTSARRVLRIPIRFARDVDRQRIHNAILGGGPELLFGIPQWQEAQPTTAEASAAALEIFFDTTAATLTVGQVMSFVLEDGTSLEGQIAAIAADRVTLEQALGTILPVGTMAVPLLNGHVSSYPGLGIYPVNAEDLTLSFTITQTPNVAGVPASLAAAHPVDGLPILIGPNLIEAVTKRGRLTRNDRLVDGQTGIQAVTGTEPIGIFESEWLADAESPAAIYAWRQLADELLGSWGLFYAPTFQNDLPLENALTSAATAFEIPNLGVFTYLNKRAPRRDVRIEHPEGVDYRRIVDVVDNGSTETLTVNAPLATTVPHDPADVRISWLTLARIAGDVVTLRHRRRGFAEVVFNYRSVTE